VVPDLRWAHLEESNEPNGLRIPAGVSLQSDPNDLKGEALKAFKALTKYWNEQHSKAESEQQVVSGISPADAHTMMA